MYTLPAQHNAEDRANSAFFKVMQSAPMGLLISAALGFALVGIFQFLFYLDVLPSRWQPALLWVLSIGLSAFFEGLAFFFLLTTVRDFSAGAKREGWIGALASFLLLTYCMWEAHHIAGKFDDNTPEGYWTIAGIVGTITVILRVVELRIALTVTHEYKRKSALAEAEVKMQEMGRDIKDLSSQLVEYKRKEEQEALRLEAEAEAQLQKEMQRIEEERESAHRMALQEAERLKRQLASMERTKGIAITSVSAEDMKRKAREFYERNGIPPTQQQVAEMCGLKDAKSVRLKFPNGAWERYILSIKEELQGA